MQQFRASWVVLGRCCSSTLARSGTRQVRNRTDNPAAALRAGPEALSWGWKRAAPAQTADSSRSETHRRTAAASAVAGQQRPWWRPQHDGGCTRRERRARRRRGQPRRRQPARQQAQRQRAAATAADSGGLLVSRRNASRRLAASADSSQQKEPPLSQGCATYSNPLPHRFQRSSQRRRRP